MKSTGSVSRNAPNRPPRTQTIVLLSVFIILSAALTLLSGSNLKVLNGYYESGSSSSTSESRRQQQRKHQPQPPTPHNLTPAKTLLDPNVRYLSYLPFAGLTNQFMGLQNAMYAAKLLNRTLIIPPIVSNVHDNDNTHQRWSLYFDMQKFTNLTGVQVVEWDSVRPLTDAQRQVGRDQANWATALGRGGAGGGGGGGGGGGVEPESDAWAMVAENITCQIIYGYGTPRTVTSPSARMFAWHFLFRMVYQSPPPLQPGMKTWDNAQLSGGQATWDDLVTIQDLVQRYKDHQDQLLLLSNTFKLRDPETTGFYWTGMGANVHFVPQLMEYATARVNEVVKGDQGIIAVPNDDPEEQPDSLLNDTDTEKGAGKIAAPKTRIPYIAVHLRRGDIGTKCGEADMEKCLIPFTVYTEGVARARTAASRGLIARLPVVVTTDSQDEKDFEEIKALGWHRLDHDKLGTRDLWGSFGPAMVDAAILAHADGFVASTRSTMSRVAAARQKSWFGRMTIYPGVRHDPPALDGTAPITSPRRTRRSDFSEDIRIVY